MKMKMTPHNSQVIYFREFLRRCLRIFDWESSRDREYNFARRNIVGNKRNVLDVGGCESILPLQLAKKGFNVTVVDFRDYPKNYLNINSIKGDFLRTSFTDYSFDYVVLISTIEHIGFGSYGAPIYEDGDLLAMDKAKRVVKPNGKIIITFPFVGKHQIIPGFERWYDIERVKLLFEGLYILSEEYYIPDRRLFGRWVNFAPASLEQMSYIIGNKGGYQGCACYVVSPSPSA